MKTNEMPNIGSTLAYKLKEIGVNSAWELGALGSQNALIRISALENSSACLSMLYALEGAIQGIRWHSLDKDKKLELKEFYEHFKKSQK